jgi:alpha-glucosidase (family GH31 glycosyl hydrolase)
MRLLVLFLLILAIKSWSLFGGGNDQIDDKSTSAQATLAATSDSSSEPVIDTSFESGDSLPPSIMSSKVLPSEITEENILEKEGKNFDRFVSENVVVDDVLPTVVNEAAVETTTTTIIDTTTTIIDGNTMDTIFFDTTPVSIDKLSSDTTLSTSSAIVTPIETVVTPDVTPTSSASSFTETFASTLSSFFGGIKDEKINEKEKDDDKTWSQAERNTGGPIDEQGVFVNPETGEYSISSTTDNDSSNTNSNPLFGYALRNPAWIESYDPVANINSIVFHGPARFSVLKDGLIRMEWSPHFPPRHYDTGSMFAINRFALDEDVPHFTTEVDGTKLILTTNQVKIEYSSDIDPLEGFTSNNLKATILSLGTIWSPGQVATGSLHGTIRTLDRISRSVPLTCEQPAYMNDTHCEEGVLSKDGWAIVDDSMGSRWEDGSYGRFFVFTEVAPWPWITGPAESPPPPTIETCAADRSMSRRFECIWGNNVDEGACLAKGCCFDSVIANEVNGQPPALHFTPWCYWPMHPSQLQAHPGISGSGLAGYQDLYLFGNGRDYKKTLQDLTFVSGKVPLMPRYQLGPHFSRWYPYADFEERDLTATYGRLGIPIDVMVIDTDWHSPYERGFPNPPEGVHVEPWTGYDVTSQLFPAPKRLIDHWHVRNVHTGWNLHLPPLVPRAGGIQYLDHAYSTMASIVGTDPTKGEPILGDYGNLTWVSAFLDLVIAPLTHSTGLDFWWLDWQQGEAGVGPGPGLSVTQLLSYIFSSAPQLWAPMASLICTGSTGCKHEGNDFYPPRPTLMNRWGGLGSHRFPVGFSGDAETSWDVLKLQSYMTPTAANTLFQWSHDIGGFAGQPDSELMIRWSQFGVFSPVLRPHCAGRGGASRDLWAHNWSPGLKILRTFFRLRAMLVPYLATAQRIAYDTGILPVHPLYYEHPNSEHVYHEIAQQQFYFGSNIWVAPIVTPSQEAGGLTKQIIYFPPGSWIEWNSFQAHSGSTPDGDFYTRGYTLDEMPIFSSAGSIIPLRTLPDQTARSTWSSGHSDLLGTASEVPSALTFWVFPPGPHALGGVTPGESNSLRFSSHGMLYDDDGKSLAYVENAASHFLWTETTCEWWRSTNEEEPNFTLENDNIDQTSSSSSLSSAEKARRLGFDLRIRDQIRCEIHPPIGKTFPTFPLTRTYLVRFISTYPPESVFIVEDYDEHMQPAAWHNAEGPSDTYGDGSRFPTGINSWSYDASTASTWVNIGLPANPSAPLLITLSFAPGVLSDDPILTSAIARKVSRAQFAKVEMAKISWSAFPMDIPSVLRVANVASVVDDILDSLNIAGGATSLSSALVRGTFESLHNDIIKGLEEVDSLEGRLANMIDSGTEEGRKAKDVIAVMKAILSNAIQ